MTSRARTTALAALPGLLAGCLAREPGACLLPDDLVTGMVLRPVHGRRLLFRESTTVPMVRVQAGYAVAERLDAYGRFDFINGHIALTDGLPERFARGDMEAVGVGLSYAPFEGRSLLDDHLRIEVGGELYHADFAVLTKAGSAVNRVGDSAYGWNLDFAVRAGLPLSPRLELIFAAGYLLGNNWSDRVDLDFDGTYYFFGLRFDLAE